MQTGVFVNNMVLCENQRDICTWNEIGNKTGISPNDFLL
jgi:hypothetical protein